MNPPLADRFYHRTLLQNRRSAGGGPDFPQHPQAVLFLSEVVTIGALYAMKRVSRRAFYHRLTDNYGQLFPKLPDRTRLLRRLEAKSGWTGCLLAQPTLLGVADRYGIELGHPIRQGRRFHQIGKKGKSNHRWVVGGKLCIVLNKFGLITDWDCATANVHDQITSMTRPSCPCSTITTAKWWCWPTPAFSGPKASRPT